MERDKRNRVHSRHSDLQWQAARLHRSTQAEITVLTKEITEHLETLHQGWCLGTRVIANRTIDLASLESRTKAAAVLCRAAAAAGELPALLEKLEHARCLLASPPDLQ